MKKTLSLLLTAVLLLSLCPAAFAQEAAGYELPVLPDGHPEDTMPAIPDSSRSLSDDEVFHGRYGDFDSTGILKVSISQSGSYFTGVTWTATVTGGSGDYTYDFYVIRPVVEDGEQKYYSIATQFDSSNSFSYTFTSNGDYQIWVEVSDMQRAIWTQKIQSFTVTGGNDPLDFTVSMSGQPFTGLTTWTVNATGGSGSYKYSIYLSLPDANLDADTVTYNHGPATENTISYQLLASGDYKLNVWLYDANSNASLYKSFPYSFSSPDHPPVSDKVSALVAECRAAGCTEDYETALWLHDWITEHANYDVTYTHYGPDGILLGGTGVCDSYSKAYMLLLLEAGIDAARSGNDGHAWNVIQIGGKWYYVDATWDDPVQSSTSAPGGMEHHLYFCIPDEILAMNHPDYTSPHVCTSYEDNYYVHSGDGEQWAADFYLDVQAALQNGDFFFSVDLPDSYFMERWYYNDRSSPGAALADKVTVMLAGRMNYAFGSQPISLNLFKTLNSASSANALVVTEDKTLYLPQYLTEIGPQAFEGDSSCMSVDIPSHVTKIDSGAFLGCDGLWIVTIPPSVVSFGANAFDKTNPHLTLGVAEGSDAYDYAVANGFKFMLLDYISSVAPMAP